MKKVQEIEAGRAEEWWRPLPVNRTLSVNRYIVRMAATNEDTRGALTGRSLLEADGSLTEIVRRLVEAYRPSAVYLFGSMARADAGPDSDYDLLLVVPDDAPVERQDSTLAYEVLRGTGVAADVLVCSKGYFDARLHLRASLPATVVREGVLLHAA